jgi:copper chaperone
MGIYYYREMPSMENIIQLSIEGMHCGACERRVTTALAGVDGARVESVAVGSAQIKFDSAKTSTEAITAAVNRIGFTARVQSTSGK